MKSVALAAIVCLALLSQCVHSLNILGIFPYEGKSHFFVFKVLLQELAERGHNVTVVSHFPEKDPPKNYHDIELTSDIVVEGEHPMYTSRYLSIFYDMVYLTNMGKMNCEALVGNTKVKEMIYGKWNFDVIMIEDFNMECGYGVAHKLGAPYVGVTSHILMPHHYALLGIPYNGAYMPYHFLEGGTNPTLFQRVERAVLQAISMALHSFVARPSDQAILAKHLGDIPSLGELVSRKKLTLMYTHFTLTGTQLLPTNVIQVGGYHVAKPKPLPEDLKKFMDDADHGVIFISFGSVASVNSFPPNMLEAIISLPTMLQQRFVIKLHDPTIVAHLDNVFAAKWLPQADILAHPKLLAFYSHGGMLSTTEAITRGVPLVITPIFGDQPSNAVSVQEAGLGVHLSSWDVNKETLLTAFQTVLNPKFRSRAKAVSEMYAHRQNSPMDTMIFWLEYAAKYPNHTFTSPAVFKPCYQLLGLDVWAALITLIVLCVLVLKAIFRIFFGKRSAGSEKTPSKSKVKRS